MAQVKIQVFGRRWQLIGERGPLALAVTSALEANGAAVQTQGAPDILVASTGLAPDDGYRAAALLEELRDIAAGMQAGGGRVLLLLGAAGVVPLRRFPVYSAQMAAAAATVRSLAMELAPNVVVNGLGVGLIGAPALAGDVAMQGHTALGRPGTADELAGAALFLCDPMNSYTTGQILCVDGGWTSGYGRNF